MPGLRGHLALVSCALAIAMLPGCGGSEDAPPATTSANSPTTAAAPADTATPSEPDSARASSCDSFEPIQDWSHATAPPGMRQVISATGLGAVRLRMTLQQARDALPPDYRFERSSDGEGVPWVDVMVGSHVLMSLNAGEDDIEAPIDWERRIEGIQSFSMATRTAEGLSVGDSVADGERIYGPVREIAESEIESRQLVEFERQPEVAMRIDYSGDFEPGKRKTTRYCDGARIHAMAVWLGEGTPPT
jgi:hypothetical protein